MPHADAFILIFSVLAQWLQARKRLEAWLAWILVNLVAVGVYGLATIVFGLSEHVVLSMAALGVTGAADMVSIVVRQTMVQLETPDDMRGRVGAVNSVFIGASNQLGEFESGAAAAAIGPVGAVVLGGVGSIAVALTWWRWFPQLARRDRLIEPPSARSAG